MQQSRSLTMELSSRERLKTRGQCVPLINASAPPQDGRNGRLSSFSPPFRDPPASAAPRCSCQRRLSLSHHYAYFSATKERSRSPRWKARPSGGSRCDTDSTVRGASTLLGSDIAATVTAIDTPAGSYRCKSMLRSRLARRDIKVEWKVAKYTNNVTGRGCDPLFRLTLERFTFRINQYGHLNIPSTQSPSFRPILFWEFEL